MGWNILLPVLAAVTGVTALAGQDTVADPQAIDILALDRDRHERLTVPVTIQGKGPFQFMVDTGAQATVLSSNLADELHLLDRRPATLVGMSGTIPVETVGLHGLQLGKRSFYIQSAPIVDAAHFGTAHGILGLDSLQDKRVLLDFIDQEMTIADAEDTGSKVGFDIIVKARKRLGQLVITQALVDGVATSVIIDTGAQGSIGNPALLERLRRTREMGPTDVIDVSGQRMTGMARQVDALAIGRVQIQGFPVVFMDSPPFHALNLQDEPTLILGMRELRLFRRVAIDFRSRQVLFDLPRSATGIGAMKGGRFST